MAGKEEAFVPKDAIDFLGSKKIIPTDSWDDLWQGEHSQCFTVAHSMGAAVLDDIFKAVSDSLANGETLESFKGKLGPLLKENGWWGGRSDKVGDEEYLGWRLKMIYDTNLMTAYAAGNYRRLARGAELRPIWVYSAVLDGRTRPEHRLLSGKAFRADNAFWDRYYPPNGWKCRCTVYSKSEDGAARDGIDVLDDLPPGIDPSRMAPPEWRYNPGKESLSPDWSKYKNLAKSTDSSGNTVVDLVKKTWSRDLVRKGAAPRTDSPSAAPEKLMSSVAARINEGFTTETDVRDVGKLVLDEVEKAAADGANPRAALFDALKRVRPLADTNAVHSYAKGSSVRGRALIEQAQSFYPKEWVEKSAAASTRKPVTIRLGCSRAYYSPGSSAFRLRDNLGSCVHEMAHRMESTVPGLKDMEKAFYDRRTSGESTKTLRSLTRNSGYKSTEITKKDDFLDPYMGRDYNGSAYEILSMGVESLVNGHYDLIKNDTDYASFIVGLLAGL
jgi:SPP1 gp7 family putative phage head morphogenesis protein